MALLNPGMKDGETGGLGDWGDWGTDGFQEWQILP